MLLKLRLQNCFTHKDTTWDFERGLTAITGMNGTGKSLVLEMFQFALWGTAALRGVGADYKDLIVDADFMVRGKPYHISRTIKDAMLNTHEGVQASGIKAVNTAVRNLFGYNFEVFQVANAANQGSINRLGDMKPTERKKMVDEVIGLNVLEVLEKYIGEEIKVQNGVVTALQGTLREPVAPEQPAGVEASSAHQARAEKLRLDMQTVAILQTQADKFVNFPDKPNPEPDDALLDSFKQELEARNLTAAQLAEVVRQLAALPAVVEAVELEADDAQYETLQQALGTNRDITTKKALLESQLAGAPDKIEHTEEQLVGYEETSRLILRCLQRNIMEENLVRHECPACKHTWHDADTRLADYSDVPRETPAAPALAADGVLRHRERNRKYAAALVLREQLAALPALLPDPTPALARIEATRTRYRTYEVALASAGSRVTLEDRQAELTTRLTVLTDRGPDIKRIEATRQRFEKYKELHAAAVLEQTAKETARKAVEAFPKDLATQHTAEVERFSQAVAYEAAVAMYAKAKATYETDFANYTRLQVELGDWRSAKEAFAELRATVKGYLLPSLNKVASILVNEMTGGVLPWVVVNEEFEITVAGQRLETLSGAGKSVANLALRLGLGQVLTNAVFPCLLLDEIDASCDDQRAAYIAACLRRLTGTISQIVLVSHKASVEADHYVRIGQ